MVSTTENDTPIYAGIFGDPDHVEDALNRLKANGFKTEEVSVVTTVSAYQDRFRDYLDQSHAGSNVEGKTLTRAGVAGMLLGGVAALAVLFTTSRSSAFVLGAFAGIALLGTFVALMMTRGMEKEPADFFDQELDKGNILVAIEEHGDEAEERLNHAKEILRDAGSKPIPLAEG